MMMKYEIFVTHVITIGILSLTFIDVGAANVDSSAITDTNEENVLKAKECIEDLSWIYLFLYTLVVAYAAYFLGTTIVAVGLGHHESDKNGFFAAKLLKTRNQFKFILISKLVRNRKDGTNELRRKLKESDSSELDNSTTATVPKYELQKHRLADAILNGYIFPWYDAISDDQVFPICTRQILLSVLTRVGKKFEQVDRTTLAKEVILLLHCHWTEYCVTLERNEGCQDEKNPKNIVHKFRAIHSYFQDNSELAKQYQALTSILLKDVIPTELQSDLLCGFLSSILVKGFIFYYANLICNPKWLNSTLISVMSLSQNQRKLSTAVLTPTTTQQKQSFPTTPEFDDSSRPGSANAVLENISSVQFSLGGDDIIPEQLPVKHLADDQDQECSNSNSTPRVPSPAPGCSSTSTSLLYLCKDENIAATIPAGSPHNEQPTISCALSGLLSTTLMPLLPDGSIYEFPDKQQQDSLANSTTTTGSRLENFPRVLDEFSRGSKSDDEELLGTNFGAGAKINVSNKTRHLSVNETPRKQQPATQTHLEKTTHSLDDTRHESRSSIESTMMADSNFRKSASPMYEEAEDFAATIAKLRSLLEQKKSQTNLEEMNFSSGGDGRDGEKGNNSENESCDSKENLDKMSPGELLNSQSSVTSSGTDGSGGNTLSQSLDYNKLMTDDDLDDNDLQLRRIFLNVVITKTETIGADSSAQSMLFCIQYEGVYVEDGDDENTQRLVLRTTTVKRRFKEFLTLQSQLEENPIWKPHLKQIKSPTKWLTLSFPNQNSINQRKIFLENYLKQLCYHPILGFAKELRQFMAYGEDGFQEFEMLTSSSLSFQRLDKLAKTFSGVFHSLKDVLPTFEAETVTAQTPSSPDAPENKDRFSPNDQKAKKMFASFFNFSEKVAAHRQRNQEVVMDAEKGHNDKDNSSPKESGPDAPTALELLESMNLQSEKPSVAAEFKDGELVLDGSLETVYPLASVFIQLLCDVLWLPPHRPHVASIAAFMSISGKSLESHLQETLNALLSEDAITTYLEWLTGSINSWMISSPGIKSDELPDCTKTDLKNSLRQKIPAWGRWMWGRKRLEVTLDRLSGFCQQEELNHDFLLSLCELIFSKVLDISDEINDNVISCQENK